MTRRKPHRKPAAPPVAKHPNPTIALVDEKNAEIAELKRKLNATRRKLRAANADVAAAARLQNSLAATAAGAKRLARANGIEESLAFTDVVDQTIGRLTTIKAWTKLATERLLAALGGQPIEHPTFGWVLTLIENLIEDRRLFGACVCGAAGLPNDAHKQTPFAVIESITQSTELIARLAHNLSEGDEQEKIAAATPAEQRARVEESVFELGLLSLLAEMRGKAKTATTLVPGELTSAEDQAEWAPVFGDRSAGDIELRPGDVIELDRHVYYNTITLINGADPALIFRSNGWHVAWRLTAYKTEDVGGIVDGAADGKPA